MGAFSTMANVGLDAAMSRSKSGNASAEIEAEAARDIADVHARDAAARKKRERELRERTATARAKAASAGTGGASGSAAAVRRGIRDEALEEDALAVRERDMAVADIRARAAAQKRRNLLESRNQTTKQAVGGAISIGRSLLDF